MQAIFIQQDAIKEIYEAVIGWKPQIATTSDWMENSRNSKSMRRSPGKTHQRSSGYSAYFHGPLFR